MDRLLREASDWLARLHAPDCSVAERAACEQWRRESPQHEQAFSAAQIMFVAIGELSSRDALMQALAQEAWVQGGADTVESAPAQILDFSGARSAVLPRPRAHKSAAVAGRQFALAASLVVALLCGVLVLSERAWQPATYTTTSAAIQDVTLADGSVVRLDVNSQIDVQMNGNSRQVTLARGRAIFDVAHDSSRPFSVISGRGEVIAVGTRFQVELIESELVVLLESGIVDVLGHYPSGTQRDRLQPGEQLLLDQGAATQWKKFSVDAITETSWSRGRHVFRNVRLDYALAAVNRYADTKVRLSDPQLGELLVSGNFVSGDSELVASAFTAALALRSVATGSEIILFPAREP